MDQGSNDNEVFCTLLLGRLRKANDLVKIVALMIDGVVRRSVHSSRDFKMDCIVPLNTHLLGCVLCTV